VQGFNKTVCYQDLRMQKLIPEQIIRTASVSLAEADSEILNKIKKSQLLILFSTYIIISVFCMYVWKIGAKSIDLDNKSLKVHFTDQDNEALRAAIPYVCSLIFLVATFFFVKFLIQSIIPIIRDIKNEKKLLVYYIPAKLSMPPFKKYYISTPLFKNQQVEVSKEEFESLNKSEELCLEVAPCSFNVLRLTKDQKVIKYH
jgi:hypothetical protein